MNVSSFKKYIAFSCAFVLVFASMCTPLFVSAETYSRDYPQIANSGSGVWLDCYVDGYGWYCIVLPNNIDLKSFGFDYITGYNLINNTASVIKGKAYATSGGSNYMCQWGSFDQLYFYVNNGVNYRWQGVTISKIRGTTLQLVDDVSDRQNDYILLSDTDKILIVVAVFLFVIGLSFIVKRMWRA